MIEAFVESAAAVIANPDENELISFSTFL